MKYLLKSATILSPTSKWNKKKMDILIENGRITKIAKSITESVNQTISSKNLHVSIGWFDLCASFAEPGEEQKESLASGLEAAKCGGFTGLAMNPNTHPAIDSKGQVEFLKSKSKNAHCSLYPIGAISTACKGEELAELYDMELAGAKAFSDYTSIENSELFKIATLYSKNLKGQIMDFPLDASLSKGGQMNEGKTSTSLGLKGIPELAEIVRVKRNLDIANYCETGFHFRMISSPDSLKEIKKAKSSNEISSSVAIANLVWDDQILKDFDSTFKVLPPLRSEDSMKKLRKAVLNEDIDCIVSNHVPQDIESKRCEFEYASFGMASLESFFKLLLMAFGDKFSEDAVISAITNNPREVLGLETKSIDEACEADLCLFDPDLEYKLEQNKLKSKAVNYPLIHLSEKGKIIGSFRGKSVYIAD